MSLTCRACIAVLLAAWLAWPGVARAQHCGAPQIDIDFGTVSARGGATSANVPVECQSGALQTYFTICLYMSIGHMGSVAPRLMTDYGGSLLRYDLYGDAARNTLIGEAITTPAYQERLVVPGSYHRGIVDMVVHGWVHEGQSVPPTRPDGGRFQEHGVSGQLYYRYDTSGYPETADCVSGGSGGGIGNFGTSGIWASFEESCTLSASDLDFGDVGGLTTVVDNDAVISVSCPAGTHWSLGLGNGRHYASGSRRMAHNGEYVAYGLYLDANRSQPWGDTGADDRHAGSTGASGAAVGVSVWGRVPIQPDVPAGEYLDTVIVTLYY